jgi:uncharacterized protein YggE
MSPTSRVPGSAAVKSRLTRSGTAAGVSPGDAVRVQGLTPALHDMAAPGSTARARAFGDAQAKAQQYAALAGRTLGSVVTIDASTSRPQDTASTARAAAGTASAAAPRVPVAAGSVPVDVTVSVVFSLR